MANFDQRNQKVKNQVNVSGNVNLNLGQDQIHIAAQLQKLQEELSRLVKNGDLDENIAIDAEANIKKAAIQSQKPEPDKKSIIENLLGAQELIKGVSAATGLVKILAEVIEVIKRILP